LHGQSAIAGSKHHSGSWLRDEIKLPKIDPLALLAEFFVCAATGSEYPNRALTPHLPQKSLVLRGFMSARRKLLYFQTSAPA